MAFLKGRVQRRNIMVNAIRHGTWWMMMMMMTNANSNKMSCWFILHQQSTRLACLVPVRLPVHLWVSFWPSYLSVPLSIITDSFHLHTPLGQGTWPPHPHTPPPQQKKVLGQMQKTWVELPHSWEKLVAMSERTMKEDSVLTKWPLAHRWRLNRRVHRRTNDNMILSLLVIIAFRGLRLWKDENRCSKTVFKFLNFLPCPLIIFVSPLQKTLRQNSWESLI